MSGSIDKYQNARRSGRYTHPRQEEIFKEGPVFSKNPWGESPSAIKETNWKKWVMIALSVLVLITAYRWFTQPKELQKLTEQAEQVRDDVVQAIDDMDLFTGSKEIKLEARPVAEVPQYVKEQELAFEKLRAWERLTKQAIDRFYDTPVQDGFKRTLCIAVDGSQDCKSRSGSVENRIK